MKVYHSIDEFVPLKNAVVTIGTFDGVHVGHRKIISGIKELAESTGGAFTVFSMPLASTTRNFRGGCAMTLPSNVLMSRI